MKNRLTKYGGVVGLLLLVLSLIRFTMPFTSAPVNWILLGVGALLLAGYLWQYHQQVTRFFSSRSFRYSSHIALMTLLVFGIVVLVNVIFARHNLRWDTTRAKLFSLSPQSKKIVRQLKDRVEVKAFVRPGNRQDLVDLLEEYANISPRFHYETIDPDLNPGLVKQYQIKEYGTVVFEYGDRLEKITESGEQEITNALIKVTRETTKKIYFTTNHGEHDIDDINPEGLSEARKGIEAENYEVEKIFLAEQQQVPRDCAVLVVAGPRKDLLEPEYGAIEAYLEKGGKLLVLLDPEQPDLGRLLKKWGFAIGKGTVIDVSPVGQLFGAGYGSPLIASYEPHEITRDFNLMTLFRLARPVTPVEQPDSGITVQSLIMTTDYPGSWAEADLQAEEVQFDEGKDVKGPISLAAVAEKAVEADRDSSAAENESGQLKTRIGVFGDSDFVTNAYYHFQGNGDLFLNVIGWLAEQGDLISIRAKQPEDNRVSLSVQQSRFIFWFGVVLLPIAILVVGVVVYVQRK